LSGLGYELFILDDLVLGGRGSLGIAWGRRATFILSGLKLPASRGNLVGHRATKRDLHAASRGTKVWNSLDESGVSGPLRKLE